MTGGSKDGQTASASKNLYDRRVGLDAASEFANVNQIAAI